MPSRSAATAKASAAVSGGAVVTVVTGPSGPSEAGPPASEVVVRPRLWTRTFVLLCAVSFFCYVHWSLLGPVLPLYIQEHGGSATLVGAVAFAFSVTSFTLRPLLGRLVDTWKIRGVAAIGTLLLTTMSLGYLAYNVVLLLVIRGIHGFGWACYNTGCNTLVSRIAPVTRRGEAVGFMTTAQSIAIAILPSTGLWLLGWIGFTGIFILSALAGLMATLAVVAMPRQPPPPPRPAGENFWRSLFEPTALMPSTLHFLSQLPHSLTVTFIPIYATARGIPVGSLVFYYLSRRQGAARPPACQPCRPPARRAGRQPRQGPSPMPTSESRQTSAPSVTASPTYGTSIVPFSTVRLASGRPSCASSAMAKVPRRRSGPTWVTVTLPAVMKKRRSTVCGLPGRTPTT